MSSYQTTPYTHFHELVDTCTKYAQSIETQVKSLSDKVRILGTSSDTPDFRARLDDDEQRLHTLANKTKNAIKELFGDMTKRKKDLSKDDLDMIPKVKTAMMTAMKNYEDVIKKVSNKRQEVQNPKSNTLVDFGEESPRDDNIQQRLQLQQQFKMNNDLLLRQNEELLTIEEQLNVVQTDVIEINHLMCDIGALVSEQSPIVAVIERNVTSANDHIVAGNVQLLSASSHQKKYRKKICYLLLVFLIVAVIVAVVILIKLKA